jgi:hypothetical protein
MVIPELSNSSRFWTGYRIPRMQGCPWQTAGSIVIRVSRVLMIGLPRVSLESEFGLTYARPILNSIRVVSNDSKPGFCPIDFSPSGLRKRDGAKRLRYSGRRYAAMRKNADHRVVRYDGDNAPRED